jgi:hypothetical protein
VKKSILDNVKKQQKATQYSIGCFTAEVVDEEDEVQIYHGVSDFIIDKYDIGEMIALLYAIALDNNVNPKFELVEQ